MLKGRPADIGGVSRVTDRRLAGLASWRQPAIPGRERQETTMHPALQHDLIQARQHDLLRSAAQQRPAAQARTARLPRRGRTPAAPRRRMLHLVWRLLPA